MEENLLVKLKKMQDILSKLMKKDNSEGWENLSYQINLLERMIDRIYPDKEARKMKIKLHSSPNMPNDFMLKKEIAYKEKIKRAKVTIKLIIEESELFGFDDFKPIKEKVETEGGIKTGLLNFKRKVTREK